MRLRTENLTKKYRVGSSEIKAVDQVSLNIDEPTFVAMIGPSGSGKTTFLNLLGLNDSPTSGKVFVDKEDTSRLTNGKRRKIRLFRIGFVFQTFNLLPTLNALENVELPMSLVGVSQKRQREKAVRLLEAVGLGNRVSHRPRELSMGEMQRVAIARALANDPETIIADEPTGELDSNTAREVINLLSDINRSRKVMVIVASHDEKVVDAADVVYMIQDGKLELRA
jgi:putative ABC transport system ATP-binding protein